MAGGLVRCEALTTQNVNFVKSRRILRPKKPFEACFCCVFDQLEGARIAQIVEIGESALE